MRGLGNEIVQGVGVSRIPKFDFRLQEFHVRPINLDFIVNDPCLCDVPVSN